MMKAALVALGIFVFGFGQTAQAECARCELGELLINSFKREADIPPTRPTAAIPVTPPRLVAPRTVTPPQNVVDDAQRLLQQRQGPFFSNLNDGAVSAQLRPAPAHVVTPGGTTINVPEGARGPLPTRAPGVQYVGGSGGPGMDSRVSSVRIMDQTEHHPARVIYENSSGQKVNPATGQTVANKDPEAHNIIDEQ